MLAAAAVLLLAAAPDAGVGVGVGVGFKWEYPPQTLHEIPIDGTTYVDGIPVRLKQLLVVGTPEQIGRHFLESFKRQDLYVAPRQAIDRLLTGVDPGTFHTYSVVLQPNAAGKTTVVLGEARVLDRKKPPPDGLPVLPQAKAIPVRFEGSEVLSYLAASTLADAQAFYARALAERGYQPSAKDEGVWFRPGERVELTLAEKGKQVQVVLKRVPLGPAPVPSP